MLAKEVSLCNDRRRRDEKEENKSKPINVKKINVNFIWWLINEK
jgi:hypothetical protein